VTAVISTYATTCGLGGVQRANKFLRTTPRTIMS
jgi:hypothetical protein